MLTSLYVLCTPIFILSNLGTNRCCSMFITFIGMLLRTVITTSLWSRSVGSLNPKTTEQQTQHTFSRVLGAPYIFRSKRVRQDWYVVSSRDRNHGHHRLGVLFACLLLFWKVEIYFRVQSRTCRPTSRQIPTIFMSLSLRDYTESQRYCNIATIPIAHYSFGERHCSQGYS